MRIEVKNLGVPGVSPITSAHPKQQTAGFGYIFIPKGVDRDSFVKSCFRKNKISIIDDSAGNILFDCYISSEALANLTFPSKDGEKGMGVIWISQPFLENPIIIGTFNNFDQITLQSDEEINIRKAWGTGFLEIKGNAKDGRLYINANGKEFGEIHLSALGNNAAAIHVSSNGIVNISGDENVNLVTNGSLSINAINPENNNTTGFSLDKDTLMAHTTFGDNENGTTVTITEEEVSVETVINETKSVLTITEESLETTLQFKETTFVSSTNEQGTQSTITIGETSYQQTIDETKAETLFQDCTIKMEEEKLTLSQGDAMVEISGGKLAVVNNGTGLNELLTKIVDAIATLTVSTAVGPSGTPLPPTIQKTTELTNLLKQFFNK